VVDDNPVVLKLYARLFKRAGFTPTIARNGQEALDTIVREKPDVAVIDYMLPILSGIEVCRRIRKMKEFANLKIIIFTSDTKPETKDLALSAGADVLVVKSSDAQELIRKVVEILQIDGKKKKSEIADFTKAEQLSEEILNLFNTESVGNNGTHMGQSSPGNKVYSNSEGNVGKVSYIPVSLSEKEILDRENLLKNLDNDIEFLQELVEIFRKDARKLIERIGRAILEKNANELHRNAHTLKGSLGNLGSRKAFELARALEFKGGEGDFSETNRLFAELKRNVKILEDHMENIIMSEKSST